MRDKLPVPTQEDYEATIDLFEAEYREDQIHWTIREMARELPPTMLEQIWLLGKAVNPVDQQALSRQYDHHDLLRAIAYGAATGVMIGQNVYQHNFDASEVTWFRKEMLQAADDEGDVVDDEIEIESEDVINLFRAHTDQVMSSVGGATESWLKLHSEKLLKDAEDEATKEWYLVGAARTLFLLQSSAEIYNQD